MFNDKKKLLYVFSISFKKSKIPSFLLRNFILRTYIGMGILDFLRIIDSADFKDITIDRSFVKKNIIIFIILRKNNCLNITVMIIIHFYSFFYRRIGVEVMCVYVNVCFLRKGI